MEKRKSLENCNPVDPKSLDPHGVMKFLSVLGRLWARLYQSAYIETTRRPGANRGEVRKYERKLRKMFSLEDGHFLRLQNQARTRNNLPKLEKMEKF